MFPYFYFLKILVSRAEKFLRYAPPARGPAQLSERALAPSSRAPSGQQHERALAGSYDGGNPVVRHPKMMNCLMNFSANLQKKATEICRHSA